MKSEMVQLQQNAVQIHTATMLEIGTSLLSQTAEQTRKLTDVETQVCSQSSFLKAFNCWKFYPCFPVHYHTKHFNTGFQEIYTLV